MSKILIIEDDTELAAAVADALLKEKYVVDQVHTGEQGEAYLQGVDYDLVILDWGLPDIEGVDICKKYRSDGGTAPILFLTGRSTIGDKMTGLDIGADDYLTKPFEIRELLARVRALLRRPRILQSKLFTARGITLDPAGRTVSKDGKEITLYPKEFNLLEVLMRSPGKVFTVDELLDKVWPTDADASVETVRQTILRLRQKVEFDPDNPMIRTLRNVGYRLDP